MAEQTDKGRENRPPLVFAAAAIVAAGLLAGLFVGGRMAGSGPMTADAKLQIALQAFRTGYDQSALAILEPLAKEGNAKAQYWLAEIYSDDNPGSKPDMAREQSLLEKSAAQGFVPAERRLGELYLRGTRTFQDFGKAQDWLHKAAIAGDANAQELLGHIYALGLGVSQDKSQAYGWYENATLHGDALAERLRDDLVKRMSPAEIDKGEQAAKQIAASIKPARSARFQRKEFNSPDEGKSAMTLQQPASADKSTQTFPRSMHDYWGLFLAEGIVLSVLGLGRDHRSAACRPLRHRLPGMAVPHRGDRGGSSPR